MNTKLKSVRFVLAVTFASLLWAGCASPSSQTYYVDASADTQPVDLTKRRADTHPELRSGLEQYGRLERVTEAPNPVIEEAAGAPRVPK
jgi:hypothetical protein